MNNNNNQAAGGAPPNNQAGPAGLNNTPRVHARYTGDELPALLSSLSIGEASSGGEEAGLSPWPEPNVGVPPWVVSAVGEVGMLAAVTRASESLTFLSYLPTASA